MEIIPEKSRKLLGSFAKMTPRQIRKWATLGWASYGRFVQMNANDKPAGRKQYLGFVLKNVFGEEKPQIVADIEPFYREILSVYPDWESMSVQTQNEYLFAGTGFLCWQNLPCPKCNKDLLAEAKDFFLSAGHGTYAKGIKSVELLTGIKGTANKVYAIYYERPVCNSMIIFTTYKNIEYDFALSVDGSVDCIVNRAGKFVSCFDYAPCPPIYRELFVMKIREYLEKILVGMK